MLIEQNQQLTLVIFINHGRQFQAVLDDIVAEAAALLESLAINHPFVDGNKRITFAAANVFLRINGWRVQRTPMRIYVEMMQMFDSGTFDIACRRRPRSDNLEAKNSISAATLRLGESPG
ncbi:MAG: type II toxin-antitoxin system death-on-curing family toxin [Alcaligenaceae bacterium]|nr:type II toxin-antitoxin system death-on-curing family toxin [Alcaligenaceae bacterium]